MGSKILHMPSQVFVWACMGMYVRTYKLTHVCVFTQIEINREFLVIKQLK